MIQATDALTGTVQYGYDAAGNTTAITTGDTSGSVIQVETQQYAALNRAITDTVAGPTGMSPQTTTTRYDPDGNTLQTTTQTQSGTAPVQTSTDTATYNAADWTTSTTDNGVTTSYGYDAAGQQRTQTYQNGAATATMTLDAEGRLTALGDGAGHTSSFGYNADDQTTAITLPNGVSEQASYDANGRLTAWHDPGPGQNVTYGYAYDAASRVTSFTAVSGADTLTYNPQNRLISDNELTLATRPGCKRRSEAQRSSTSCSWRPLCRADERCGQHREMR